MRVDRTAIRVNQSFIVGLNVIAFVLGTERGGHWLVLFVALVMALGTAAPSLALFKQFYLRILKPADLLRPDVHAEDPAPHQFAQGMGAAFLGAAFVFLLAGVDVVGWALAWIVIALALVNLVVNFCAGCFIYYQLGRAGLVRGARGTAS